jgi:hypothetical protein
VVATVVDSSTKVSAVVVATVVDSSTTGSAVVVGVVGRVVFDRLVVEGLTITVRLVVVSISAVGKE